MSYAIEQRAIGLFCNAQSFFGLSPFGLDGEVVDTEAGSGFLTLVPGAARQASTGAPGANLHEYVGMAMVTIIGEGGRGSRSAKLLADAVVSAFTGLKIDEDGVAVSGSSTLTIDFTRAGVPYLATSTPQAPYHRAVVSAPFVRTERR